MSLPVIPKLEFTVKNKWTQNKPLKLVPFTVGQEALFLQIAEDLGKDGKPDKDKMFAALEQVLRECVVSKDADISAMSIFLIEYLFIQLRKHSISEEIEFRHKCGCGNVMDVKINLDDFIIKEEEGFKDVFEIEGTNIAMRFTPPTLAVRDAANDLEALLTCLHSISDGDEVFDVSQYSMEELMNFFSPISTKVKADIMLNFINKLPHIHLERKDKCSKCGAEKNFLFNSLADVFI